MESAICARRYRFSARERKGGGELAVKLKYTCNTSRSRAVIKRRGPGISPGYYECFPQLISKENIRKIEPKEIPSCLIPRQLVVFTQQLEILVTILSEGNSKTSNGTLAFFYYTTINRFKGRLGTDHQKTYGGWAKYKKYSRQGKLNEKNSCTLINPTKYSRYGLKKIVTKNLITKNKSSCGSKIPHTPPPLPHHNFANGPSLRYFDP